MKRFLVLCIVLCIAIPAFSQASLYFPDWPVSTWRYRDADLDTLSQPIDSTRSTRYVEYTGETLYQGYTAKQMRERSYKQGAFSAWDTLYLALSGDIALQYQSPIQLADSGLLGGLIDLKPLLKRFEGWHAYYRFGHPYYVTYEVFKFDTTLGVDTAGLAIILRFQVTGQRLLESTIQVPRGTYTNAQNFLVTYQLGFVGDLPVVGQQFIPFVTIQDYVWIAKDDWIVKTFRPAVVLDLSSLGIPLLPKISIPGHISELESATILTGIAENQDQTQPLDFLLLEAYPNPFNPSTVVRFNLPATGDVVLKVFDLMGRDVATLVNGTMTQGSHEVRWNPAGFASGMYIARLQYMGKSITRSLSLMK